jgi:hypothetical protein
MIWQVPHRPAATAAGAAGAIHGSATRHPEQMAWAKVCGLGFGSPDAGAHSRPIRKKRNGRLMGTQTSASGRIGPGSRARDSRFRVGVTIRTPSSNNSSHRLGN